MDDATKFLASSCRGNYLMNILFIATRAPYGRMHGHKMGIRTYLQALRGVGNSVFLAAFDVPGDTPKPEDLGIPTSYISLPSRVHVALNILTRAVPGQLSLNECLYLSSEAERAIKTLVAKHEIDFIVADMIRTAPYALATGLPWILDHEDLLSERYEMWGHRSTGDENILGYLENTIPTLLRPSARSIFRRLLSYESRVLARRELHWTNLALASSLRSAEETERLQQLTSRRVFCMPVTVPIPSQPAQDISRRPARAVFTGGLTYQPNLDALRAYVTHILPEFQRRQITPPTLDVIGAAPDDLRKPLEHETINFLGYVDDLGAELRGKQMFFAPIVSGTGIKTKVLEALAWGLPLIALPAGLTGLRGEHGVHYLRAGDAADFVDQFVRLRDGLQLASELAVAGRKLAIDFYSIEAATRLVDDELDRVRASSTRALSSS